MKIVIRKEETKMNYYYPNPYAYYNGGYTGSYYHYPNQQTPDSADEQSYIENILRLNLGKTVSVYMNFENSQWGSKIFKGKLEAAGKDHIIISDPSNNMRYLLLTIYLNYVTFDEEINYYYPYHTQK